MLPYYYNKNLAIHDDIFQAAAPACTELETIVLDWLGKMINLPDDFLSCKKGSKGGGVIQVSIYLVTYLLAYVMAYYYLKRSKKKINTSEPSIQLSFNECLCPESSGQAIQLMYLTYLLTYIHTYLDTYIGLLMHSHALTY